MLNDFVQQRVELQVPEVYLCADRDEAIRWVQETLRNQNLAVVQMGFDGDMTGSASLAFSRRSAHLLASMLGDGGGKPDEALDAIGESVLIEVGNVLMSGVMGTLGNMLRVEVHYQVPLFLRHGVEMMVADGGDCAFLVARTKLSLADLEMEGVIIVLFSLRSHDAFLDAVDRCLEAS